MLSDLHQYLRKPALYERTRADFWNDPYISRRMLEAHLNPYTDAASRNPAFMDQSVQWIVSLVPAGAHVLDLGCGPGLYARRFASRGLAVTGVDISDRSIEYATEHDLSSRYISQDYLELDFRDEFDIATLIWCDYGALTPEERQRLLEHAYCALKPGALLILDVFTPEHHIGRVDNTRWQLHHRGGFWSSKPHLCLEAEYVYGNSISVDRTVIVEDDDIREYNIWNTRFTPDSLATEVQLNGFAYVGSYGDVAGKPWATDSTILCALLQKPME